MVLISALLIGLLGSFHCVGMCGPIALALPVKSNKTNFFLGRLLYNLGRIVSYSIMGLVFGVIGKSFFIWGLQGYISILIGVVILTSLFLPSRLRNRFLAYPFLAKIITSLKTRISSLFQSGSLSILFIIGILNGFLPCGFVYVGLAGALAAGSMMNGTLFMMFFGLGTLPAMFILSLSGKLFSIDLRRKISKAVPIFAFMLAVIFILRGMNLGIPYVSPRMMSSHSVIMHH